MFLQFKNVEVKINMGSANITVIGKTEDCIFNIKDVSIDALKCEDEYTLVITINKTKIILFSETKKTNCSIKFGKFYIINFDPHFNKY